MPALNFQKQFVPLIESGKKRQTIRCRKRPIKVGDLLYLYTGQRTKNCRKIAESICLETQHFDFRMSRSASAPIIHVNHSIINILQFHKLAIADGFKKRSEFCDFFIHSPKAIEQGGVTSFSGQIIKWGMLCKP
ncbi:hypothetical protein Lepto7376_3703 [[Leptolyngbya] sp. PCC 7376]|uniref:ASCH domain-containing protein n=1 Tax=[Leptolyngbya] sp. PCC 7376 TaxID=111781 RepID=UPI00029EEE86|nr:ASCH domain-containing protein [[Leptolyngbya] sp. PCC 7376]AFY39879.1 hypothetical protein Lepto7376_3703 [[Leptolyngbya] sp. PCC 7376]